MRTPYNWGRSGSMKAFINFCRKNKRRQEKNIKDEIRDEKKKKMMMKMQMQIKMKMNKGSDDDITNNPLLIISTSSSYCLLDDDLVVCEILSRLPVKSLMRFKSVCKRWLSLIQHDPHFHELHFTQTKTHPDLFIITPIRTYDRCIGHWEYILSADMVDGRAAVHTIRKREELVYDRILDPVHGLVCFLDVLEGGVRIYNSSTGELTPWIKTTINKGKNHDRYPTFGFGFDPVTKEHKAICVWTWTKFKTRMKYTTCEILTVGNYSPRMIDEVPPYNLQGVPLYVTGSIYWLNKVFHKNEELDDCAPEVIVAFDVGSEKFRAIPIPDFIIDQPRESRDLNDYRGSSISLLDVDGHVALLCRVNCYTVSLWIFDDDHDLTDKEKIRTTTSSSSNINNWTEVTITLPFAWAGNMHVDFHTVPGTDQIIIQSNIDWSHSIYSYNWRKKTYKNVEISGISSACASRSPFLFAPLVESLFLVN